MKLNDFEKWAVRYAAPAAFGLWLMLRQPATVWATPEAGLSYEPLFVQYENQYNLPRGLLSRIAYQESRYNQAAISPVGAIGLMQFMPATAADLGIDPYDAEQSISGAARYLKWLYDQLGTWPRALAGYNFGIGNVKAGRDWPLETQKYVQQICDDMGFTV